MNVNNARQIVEVVEGLKQITSEYGELKCEYRKVCKLLRIAKANLKELQIMYWYQKEVRNTNSYCEIYKKTDELYQEIKRDYHKKARECKILKLTIKERQRQISSLMKLN